MGSSPDSTPTPSPLQRTSSLDTLPAQEPSLVQDPEQACLRDVLGLEDIGEAAWQTYDLCTIPDPEPRRAHRLATALLQLSQSPSPPIRGSSASSVHGPSAMDRLNQVKGAIALLIGLHALLISHEPDPAAAEDVFQSLVSVFIKGIIRSPRVATDQTLPNELVERIVGDVLWDQETPWPIWRIAAHLVGKFDKINIRPARDQAADRQATRILINLVYLKAVLASVSDTPALADARSSFQFTECVKLGCSIGITGASPTAPPDLPSEDAHVSTLVWKSRKRLELFGHVDVALSGLPDGGKNFDRWGGGAQEKTRQAEEKRRRSEAERIKTRRPSSSRRGSHPQPIAGGDDGDGVVSPPGALLAPPIRLKGKKVRHHRAGSYEYRKTANVLGLSGTKDTDTALRPEATFTPPAQSQSAFQLREAGMDYFQYSPSPMPNKRSVSATSLPSLERRPSTCLLRTPPTSPGPLPAHNFNMHISSPLCSPLKATTPRPLPTLFNTQPIFSLASDDFGVAEGDENEEDEAVQRSSWVKAMRSQALVLNFRLNPINLFSRRRSSSSFNTLFSSSSDAGTRPDLSSSSRNPVLADTSPPPSLSLSLSSQSTMASPPPSPKPIPIVQVPSIGFTPSSHHPSVGAHSIGRGGKQLRSFTPLSSRLDARLRQELN